MKINIKKQGNTKNIVYVLFAVGVLLRIVFFVINTAFTKGIQIDEAMLSLNAYNIAEKGQDLLGNSFPVYFCTWINGGQSPVATYICALSVLLFGKSLFAVRFPSLIIGTLGLYTVVKTASRFVSNEKLCFIIVGLFSVSPWFVFSCVYTLDCNYLTYMLIFAIYFFAVALNENKSLYFVLSMLFFSLGFNSYIASVLIIPIFLVVLFVTLLLQKRITFKRSIYCFLWLVLFSIPFIFFGLVATKIIAPFNIWKITFGGMENYERSNSVVLSNSNGFLDAFDKILDNLVGSSRIILETDDLAINSIGMNHFSYGYLFSGFFVIIGGFYFAYMIFKKDLQAQKSAGFVLASVFSILSFCAMTNDPAYYAAYRYGVLSVFLIPLEAVGIFAFLNHPFKKFDFKKITAVYLTLTVAMFSYVYFGYYENDTDNTADITYFDSLIDCLDYMDENKINDFDLLSIAYFGDERRTSECLRYYYGIDGFINYYDEYTYSVVDKLKEFPLSKNTVSYYYYDGFAFTEDCYIVGYSTYQKIKGTPNYNVKEFGNYYLLTKK